MGQAVVLKFFAEEDGSTAIEYGLIAAMIAVGVIGSFTLLGNSLISLFGMTEGGAGPVLDAAVETVNGEQG